MARIKLLLFAAIALGLLAWNFMQAKQAPKPNEPGEQADIKPSSEGQAQATVARAAAVQALWQARVGQERAAAQAVIHSDGLINLLGKLLRNDKARPRRTSTPSRPLPSVRSMNSAPVFPARS